MSELQFPPPGFDDLSIDEKIDYVQKLWQHVEADANSLPLTESQKQILDERLADLENNPAASIPWSQAHADLLRRISKPRA